MTSAGRPIDLKRLGKAIEDSVNEFLRWANHDYAEYERENPGGKKREREKLVSVTVVGYERAPVEGPRLADLQKKTRKELVSIAESIHLDYKKRATAAELADALAVDNKIHVTSPEEAGSNLVETPIGVAIATFHQTSLVSTGAGNELLEFRTGYKS